MGIRDLFRRGYRCAECGKEVKLSGASRMEIHTTDPDRFRPAGGLCARHGYRCPDHAAMIEVRENTYRCGCPDCGQPFAT